ncbi:MAG: efflux RND transporter periplasmic adaptor subunit [Janthinobacterium lividum]
MTKNEQDNLHQVNSQPRKRPLRIVVAVLLPVILLAGLIVWRLHANAAATKTLQQTGGGKGGAGRGPTSVGVSSARVRDIVHIFSTSANIESPETVKISPRVAEQITAITVKEGDPVRQNQVLIQLDDTQLAAAVRKEQALLAEGNAKLLQAKVSTISVVTPIQTLIRQNKAALKSSQINLRETRESSVQSIAAADAAVLDSKSKVASAQASIANAQASLVSAQANETNDNTQLARETSLFKQGAVAQQDVDNAKTVASVQVANVGVAQAQINVAQAGLQSANAELRAAEEQDTITRAKAPSDIEAARSTVVTSQSSLRNANANTVQQAAYQANIAGLQADVLSTQADLATAQAQLAETVIRSPMDGFVSSRLADPGTLASPGTPILNLQGLKIVWVNVPVPQEQIGAVAIGQQAAVTVDTIPGRYFTGKVFEIDPSADPSSRDFTIRLSLSNPQALLKPGMYAHVALVTQHVSDATVVPLEAIHTDAEGTFVWALASDSTVHRQAVTTGARDDNGVQILSGLKRGDKVVTVNGARLKDGTAVVLGGIGGTGGAGSTGKHHHKKQS